MFASLLIDSSYPCLNQFRCIEIMFMNPCKIGIKPLSGFSIPGRNSTGTPCRCSKH